MPVWEVAARRDTVSCSSWCPSLDSPRLAEYDQENPKHCLFATCRTHQPPSAMWSSTGCSSGDGGDGVDAAGDGESGDSSDDDIDGDGGDGDDDGSIDSYGGDGVDAVKDDGGGGSCDVDGKDVDWDSGGDDS